MRSRFRGLERVALIVIGLTVLTTLIGAATQRAVPAFPWPAYCLYGEVIFAPNGFHLAIDTIVPAATHAADGIAYLACPTSVVASPIIGTVVDRR